MEVKTPTTGCQWYAYKHVNGSIIPKRYFSPMDITEVRESSFVEEVRGPIEGTREDAAMLFAKERL